MNGSLENKEKFFELFVEFAKSVGWFKAIAFFLSVFLFGTFIMYLIFDFIINDNLNKELEAYKNFTGIIISYTKRDLATLSPLELRNKTLHLVEELLEFHFQYKQRMENYYQKFRFNYKKFKNFKEDWDEYINYRDSIIYLEYKRSRMIEDSLLAEYHKKFGTDPWRYRNIILKILKILKININDLKLYDEWNYLHPPRGFIIERIAFQLDALARRLPEMDSYPIHDIMK